MRNRETTLLRTLRKALTLYIFIRLASLGGGLHKEESEGASNALCETVAL